MFKDMMIRFMNFVCEVKFCYLDIINVAILSALVIDGKLLIGVIFTFFVTAVVSILQIYFGNKMQIVNIDIE
jgi:hypothetical protein